MYRHPTSLHLPAIKHAARAIRRGNAAEAERWTRIAGYFHSLDDRLKAADTREERHQLWVLERLDRMESRKRR